MDCYKKDIALHISLVFLLSAYVILKKRKNERNKRQYKTRPINRNRKSNNFYMYFLKMKLKDEDQFFKHTRMTVSVFEELLTMIKSNISRRRIKDGICAEERLALTLHFLSQGGTMQNIAWAYQMGLTTVHKIIHETCIAIWDELSPTYLKVPSTEEEWQMISTDFFTKWNFPNCIGALDGKHISIQAPPKSGTIYFNYKKFFSIVLMAVCDANYLFTMVDIGAYGSHSDGGIFRNSAFGKRLEENDMNVPRSAKIPNTNVEMPYVLVADEAFPLKQYIMRPYPGKNLSFNQKIFNYRLSRARRVIENTFGVMVARWRLLKQPITADVHNVDNIVKAIVVLHNFCRIKTKGTTYHSTYCPQGYTDTGDEENGQWRLDINNETLQSVGRVSCNNSTRICYQLRDRLTRYFLAEGQLPWQESYVLRGREPQ